MNSRDKTKEFSFKYHKKEYFLMTTVFLLSTSVYFTAHVEYLVAAFIVFGVMFLNSKKKISKDFKIILVTLTVLNLANIILFDFFSSRTTLGNYVRFLMPFFAVMLIGKNFTQYYIRVVKFFVIISFVFYIPANIIPGFNSNLREIPKFLGTDPGESNHFIIYQVEGATPWESNIPILRNSGPTGEPGEFAGYLVLAIIFELIITHRLWTKNNILFSIALFTTFSTTGFIAYFILLAAYFLLLGKVKGRIILFPLSVLLAFNIYFNFEFMYEKINLQLIPITYAQSINDIPRDARLPNLVRNLWDSFDQPIFGKGRNFETRYSNWRSMRADAFSNNVGTFPAQFGWPFFLFYTFLMYRGFKNLLIKHNYNKKYASVIVLIIFTLSISQGFLISSLFITLIYLRNIIPDKKYNEVINYNTDPQPHQLSSKPA